MHLALHIDRLVTAAAALPVPADGRGGQDGAGLAGVCGNATAAKRIIHGSSRVLLSSLSWSEQATPVCLPAQAHHRRHVILAQAGVVGRQRLWGRMELKGRGSGKGIARVPA